MSYILDALKKAEAQRRLGSAPDLLAMPAALADAADARGAARRRDMRRYLPAMALGAVLVMFLILAGWWMATGRQWPPAQRGSAASAAPEVALGDTQKRAPAAAPPAEQASGQSLVQMAAPAPAQAAAPVHDIDDSVRPPDAPKPSEPPTRDAVAVQRLAEQSRALMQEARAHSPASSDAVRRGAATASAAQASAKRGSSGQAPGAVVAKAHAASAAAASSAPMRRWRWPPSLHRRPCLRDRY